MNTTHADPVPLKASAPAFWIRDIPIFGRSFLSPMAGFSDSPYRRICRRHGAGFSFTEFVSAFHIANRSAHALEMFRYVTEERPIIFQIFGNHPGQLLRAALTAQDLGADVLDINMGCSVKHVAHKGSGAGMLRDVRRTAKMISGLVRRLEIPVTAKIRLGWDRDCLIHTAMARALEESGASMISVHGRTKVQGYKGQANWNAIAEVKSVVSIPVLGNGDVKSIAEAAYRRESTGVDGVLIGRASIGDPWLFSGRNANDRAPEEILQLMLEHLESMLDFYGNKGLILFRKHAARYLAHHPSLTEMKPDLLTAESADLFYQICEGFSESRKLAAVG